MTIELHMIKGLKILCIPQSNIIQLQGMMDQLVNGTWQNLNLHVLIERLVSIPMFDILLQYLKLVNDFLKLV